MSDGESDSDRFSRASFRQSCGKSLENTNGYSLRDFTCLAEKQLRENCYTPLNKDLGFGQISKTQSTPLWWGFRCPIPRRLEENNYVSRI